MDHPKVADVWSFNKIEYYVTFVDENIVHLSEVNTGQEIPAYPIEFFASGWHLERTAYDFFCNSCEENPKEAGDYLCYECRHGK
jgi:hypothetical protein